MQIHARSEVPTDMPFIHFGYLSASNPVQTIHDNPVYGVVTIIILLFSAITLGASVWLAKYRRKKAVQKGTALDANEENTSNQIDEAEETVEKV